MPNCMMPGCCPLPYGCVRSSYETIRSGMDPFQTQDWVKWVASRADRAAKPRRAIPPPYWPPFRWSDISEYWIFCDIVIPDGITTPPPYFWKPWMAPYVAAGAFFFPEKRPPFFWKPWMSPYVAAGAFFPRKMVPGFWG